MARPQTLSDLRGSSEQILLLDGHNLAYRSIYAGKDVELSRNGKTTKGVYFFCRLLFDILDFIQPSYVAFAGDSPRESLIRRQLYPAYKSGRSEDAERSDALEQIELIKQIVRALGIPVYELEGYEADDIIATLARACVSDEVGVTIISQDKDLSQLIDARTCKWDPYKRAYLREADVEGRFGIPPNLLHDYLVLVGDSCDGIPGVRGVGPKKALDLLREFGGLDAIVSASKRPPAKGSSLTKAVQSKIQSTDIELMAKLVRLMEDAPIEFDPAELEFDGADMEAAKPIFRELGFKRWS